MAGKMRTRGKKNKGFTLVELLVSIVILAIVIGVGMGFLVKSVGIYNRGSRESSLQNEAQLTMNRLQTLIVNASHGVSVADPASTPDPTNPTASPTLNGGDLYVYNREESSPGSYVSGAYDIVHIYQEGSQLLYCHRAYTLDGSGASTIGADKVNPQVLSEYVKSFNVDLSQLLSNNSVLISVDFENKDKAYSTSNTFLLRNEIVKNASGSADDYFKTDAEADRKKQITAISISPTDVYLWQGTSLKNPFFVTATVDGQTQAGTSVIWNLTAPEGADASIGRSTGIITAGPTVRGDLTVEATAVSSINSAGGDSSKYVSATATVHVKTYDGASLTQPQPLSEDNHKTYESIFTAEGTNLQKDVDMAGTPFVAEGSTVSATFEAQPDASSQTGLRWKVNVRRPANYLNKTYTLVVGYTLNNTTYTAAVENIVFTPSKAEEGSKIAAVRLWDSVTDNVYDGGIVSENVARGDTKNLELQIQYEGSNDWNVMDVSDWTLSSDNSDVKIKTANLTDYALTLSVKDYAKTVHANLTTTYTDNEGKVQEGPGIRLTFSPVKLRLEGVTGSQKRFPVTRGGTEQMSFVIDNLEGATVSSSEAGSRSTMYLSISGLNASVTVGATMAQSRTFSFCVKTRDGELLTDVSLDLTFVPDDANVYKDTNGNLMSLFIPKGGDLTSYNSQLASPSGDETAVLYKANGEKITYSRVNNKYHIVYNGKGYTYNSSWRGWMPD